MEIVVRMGVWWDGDGDEIGMGNGMGIQVGMGWGWDGNADRNESGMDGNGILHLFPHSWHLG